MPFEASVPGTGSGLASISRCESRKSPSSTILHNGGASSFRHAVSPKACSTLSIDFLSNGPQMEGLRTPTQCSSALSGPAGGANQQGASLNDSDDVNVATEGRYKLKIVQHPHRGAEFGASALTRLPLAPPLIAQLVMRDSAGLQVTDEMELPFLVAQLSLMSSDGSASMDYVAGDDGQAVRERLLYGNLVSSPHKLCNLRGRVGVYFTFPDVSIRQTGRFLLKVRLIRLPRFDDPEALAGRNGQGSIVAEAQSFPFDVHLRQEYVAPAQTPLTQYFLQQGAKMYVFPATI
ncbi:velvet factor-domain-containing protein [Ganoderma leucocontextum]|nr:velvet factor-domain-containing protein [Ganoderma leucocontextum]